MNPDDIRERDRLERSLKRQIVEPVLKPTVPELMRDITVGLRDDYDASAEQRAVTTRELFNSQEKP